ncbi:MAG: molecular chaperone DnaK [Myxococcales bacterium FL481]|nr:MAG: molecular chaperone DnaK [Myxococcales bacterium FL481]
MGEGIGIVLGIDLGTTNSACAVVQDGRASVVRRGTERIVPSLVAALPDGSFVVGEEARRQQLLRPSQVVFGAKRLLGRRFGSPQVQKMREIVPYRIVEGPNEAVMLELAGQSLSVVEIAAYILRYLRQLGEEALGQPVKRCVIAVPAGFSDSQRSATRVAAELAGLDVVRLINEPTAAALAYGYIEDTDKRLAVYDFGGGTFDVTVLQITRNVFEVLSTAGEMFLGGEDIDEAILNDILAAFDPAHREALASHAAARQRLRGVAEELKMRLSEEPSAAVHVENVLPGSGLALDYRLDQASLKALIEPLVVRTATICGEALATAGIRREQLDEVVLVGGTTRLPLVRQVAVEAFGRLPQTSINPMSVVAVGAAIQGAALLGSLVPVASSHPASAVPATAQTVLLDVTSRSLGVATVGGYVDFVIERNVVIPTEQTRLFTTTVDQQRYVRIQICQGESQIFAENIKIGELVLTELSPAERGEPTIAVTFEINADGLLEVRAVDRATGQEQFVTIRVPGELSSKDLQEVRPPAGPVDGEIASRPPLSGTDRGQCG